MPFKRNSHCSEADLSGYLDARLADAAKQRCDTHLAACSNCRTALEGLRAVRSSLRALPAATAQRSFRLRQAQVDSAPAPRRTLLEQAMPALSGVSAASLVAFVVLVGVSTSGGGGAGSPDSSRNLTNSAGSADGKESDTQMLDTAAPTNLGHAFGGSSPTSDDYVAPGTAEAPPSDVPPVQGQPTENPGPVDLPATQVLVAPPEQDAPSDATATQEFVAALDPGAPSDATPAATGDQESEAALDPGVLPDATRSADIAPQQPAATPGIVDAVPGADSTNSNEYASDETSEPLTSSNSIRRSEDAAAATRTAAESAPVSIVTPGDSGSDTAMSIAQAAAAAIALASGGLAFAAYRRTR